jgi:membrane-associated protein
MEHILQFITSHAHHAHFYIFSLMLLAGFNLPISEDLLIVISAILASNVVPQNTYILFAFMFVGCYCADSICYWMGRLIGPKILNISFFRKTLTENRLLKIQNYYKKYGVYTTMTGRFIPFGVRNALFLSAGLVKMNYLKFALGDLFACFLSNFLIFYAAYKLSKNYEQLFVYLKAFNILIFLIFTILVISIFCYYKYIRKRKPATC